MRLPILMLCRKKEDGDDVDANEEDGDDVDANGEYGIDGTE
jgi:hypothetical protein